MFLLLSRSFPRFSLKLILDEIVLISIKNVIRDSGFDVFTLHDFNTLGIQNGEGVKLALKEKGVIITLDSDFLQLNNSLQKKSREQYRTNFFCLFFLP